MRRSLTALVLAGAALASFSASPVFAQGADIRDRPMPYPYGHGMMWGADQWGGFGMVLGPIFMILVLAGIVAAVVYVMRHIGSGLAPGAAQSSSRALDILKERYARGEIDSKEFDERKKLLAD